MRFSFVAKPTIIRPRRSCGILRYQLASRNLGRVLLSDRGVPARASVSRSRTAVIYLLGSGRRLLEVCTVAEGPFVSCCSLEGRSPTAAGTLLSRRWQAARFGCACSWTRRACPCSELDTVVLLGMEHHHSMMSFSFVANFIIRETQIMASAFAGNPLNKGADRQSVGDVVTNFALLIFFTIRMA